jgi:RNA polymerase sigma-70 factor (ECF subfamily)
MRPSAAAADRSPSPADPPHTIGAAGIEGSRAKPATGSPPSSIQDGAPDRTAHARAAAEAVYRAESRRVFATLIRLLGDFDLAEEALAEAFRAALEQWPRDGVPANPRAWLVSAGRFKAIDGIRRRARFDSIEDHAERVEAIVDEDPDRDDEGIEDDRLRLVFTCCHPALSPDAQVALTLREVCGLTTEAIAQAFLSTPPTLAQRIVRAKSKIRDARIPYQVPGPEALPERLESVLRVIYLVFNEGYSASSGDSVTRVDLSAEAIRLGRLLAQMLPEPEVVGLLALMLLQESRRAARASREGDLILLADQDRSLWNREMIAEGSALVERALASRRVGPYTIQAAIAAVHAEAARAEATDWGEIVGLYDILLRAEPSPVVELNRAVAVAMRDGPEAGLELVDAILDRGALQDYRLAHAARADLCRRLGRRAEARSAYLRALELTRQEPERRFLERRLAELA